MASLALNFSNTIPAAPTGSVNIQWQNDTSSPTVNVSAFVPPLLHLVGATPTFATSIATGIGAGSGSVASLAGANDLSGVISLTTGLSPVGSNAVLAAVTFGVPFSGATTPKIMLTPANAAAAELSGGQQVFVALSASLDTLFQIFVGSTALSGSTTYQWYYLITQ